MKTTKALIVIAALAIATFLIGVGKYNTDYADAHHGAVLKHAA
jgi:uncharacterized ion transporter superfamily protein YfcC